ncbi:MAG TPA: hypothetical protein VK206_23445 [Anaerolineales bacterium]|nr:hypothetical protein [Anaerolineales bacterium]
MSTPSSATIGRIAIITGIVAIVGLIFIALFYALIESGGGLFGTLNDLCVASGGILSGVLVWVLYPMHRSYAPRASRFALASGLIGACLAPFGSGLVIFNITGWFMAGLVTTFGYALIGLWLLELNYSALRWLEFPRGLAQVGVVAGGVMVIGILAGPGIFAHTDAIESAQWFVLVALYAGGLGWKILYTIWCMWLGRLLLSNSVVLQVAATTEQSAAR